MNNKEKILGEGGAACEYNWELLVIPYDTAINAMQQYANQQTTPLLEALKELLIQYRRVYGLAEMPWEDYKGTVVTNAENAIQNAETK